MRALLIAILAASPAVAGPRAAPPTLVDVGPARSSLPTRDVETIEPLGARALLFHMRGRPDYRSDLTSACDYNPDRDTIIHRTPTERYDENDAIELQDRYAHIFTGTCILGPFTPVARAQPPRQP